MSSVVMSNHTVDILLDYVVSELDHHAPHLKGVMNKVATYIRKQELVAAAPPTPATKLEQAGMIYDSMPGAKRLEVIQAIMIKLDMSKAGAASYYQQARERERVRQLDQAMKEALATLPKDNIPV